MPTVAPAAAAEARQANIQAAKGTVRYGEALVLRGSFPDAPNAAVEILHRATGRSFRRVTTTRTNSSGAYSARVRPQATGSWQAQLARAPRATAGAEPAVADSTSNARRVRVRSVTIAKVSERNVLAGRSVAVRGRIKPAGSRAIKVTARGVAVKTRTSRNGKFSVRFTPRGTGEYRVRARTSGNRVAAGSSDSAGKVTAFRQALASYYGPGFYGNRTACGQTLTPGMLGVAHKTMPCGTKLTLRNGGRSVQVRVIDRGPYHGNREFDLTEATKNRLGFGSTGYVWTSK